MNNKLDILQKIQNRYGRVGWAVLWLLGVPLPILFLLFVMRGCT